MTEKVYAITHKQIKAECQYGHYATNACSNNKAKVCKESQCPLVKDLTIIEDGSLVTLDMSFNRKALYKMTKQLSKHYQGDKT